MDYILHRSKGNLRVSNSYFDSFIFQMSTSSSRGGVERNSMLLVALAHLCSCLLTSFCGKAHIGSLVVRLI